MPDKPEKFHSRKSTQPPRKPETFFYFDLDDPSHLELEERDRLEEVADPLTTLNEMIRKNED